MRLQRCYLFINIAERFYTFSKLDRRFIRNREFTDTVQIFDIIFTLIHRRKERWINLRSRPATIFRYRVFRQPESRKGIKLYLLITKMCYTIYILYTWEIGLEKNF